MRLIGATTLIGALTVTVLVTCLLTPQCMATATLLVDSRKTQIPRDQEVIRRPSNESSAIDSEAEMVASPFHSSPRRDELEREAQANRTLFEAFLPRAKETAAQRNMQMPESRILSSAVPPSVPGFPHKSLMIGLGVFGSLGLGIFLALLRGMMSESIRSASELQTAFGLKPLAAIPLVEPQAHRSARRSDLLAPRAIPTKLAQLVPDDGAAETLRLAELVVREPNSPFSESIRSLRQALRQAANGRQMSVILVTSALPGEGKSTVTANLARAAAMYGERVLLIDADLRRPSVATMFGLPPSPGLVSLVKGECGLRDAIHRDQHSDLHLIAGANRITGSDALTLLASRELQRLIGELRPNYDLILIDSSPLLPVADPRLLVHQVDGVALIVPSEQTSRSAVKAALQETPGIESKILGAVMNRVQDDFARSYPEYGSFHKVA